MEVKKYIQENEARFIDELYSLLRIPSISAQSSHMTKPRPTRQLLRIFTKLSKKAPAMPTLLDVTLSVIFAPEYIPPTVQATIQADEALNGHVAMV